MPKEPVAKLNKYPWSKTIRGLSGRLFAEFEDLNPGLRYAIYLELKNDSSEPVAMTNQPRVHAELFNSTGKPINTSGIWISGPIPSPQWAVIPRDAYIGFRIDMQTVGTPTREQGMVLIAVGGKAWEVRAGNYVLDVGVVFESKENGPQNQWVGELKLPLIEIIVTSQMLTVHG